MRQKWQRSVGGALLLTAVTVWAATAAASTVLALDLDELARSADEVVVATVLSARGEPARGTVVTRLVVRIETAVVGRARPADELEIMSQVLGDRPGSLARK